MHKSKLERQNLTLWILWNFNDNPSLQQSDLLSDCLELGQRKALKGLVVFSML